MRPPSLAKFREWPECRRAVLIRTHVAFLVVAVLVAGCSSDGEGSRETSATPTTVGSATRCAAVLMAMGGRETMFGLQVVARQGGDDGRVGCTQEPGRST